MGGNVTNDVAHRTQHTVVSLELAIGNVGQLRTPRDCHLVDISTTTCAGCVTADNITDDGLRWWISDKRVRVYRTPHPTGLTQRTCGLERVLGTDILVSAHEGFDVVIWHVNSRTVLAVSLAHRHPPPGFPCSPFGAGQDHGKDRRLGPSGSACGRTRRRRSSLNGGCSLIATKEILYVMAI